MELSASDLWSRILDGARSSLPEQSFRTWLGGCVPVALTDSELLVEAPSQFHREWIEDKYGELLHACVERSLGRPLGLSFTVSAPSQIPPTVSQLEVETRLPDHFMAPSSGRGQDHGPPPGLNERYVFQRFVVGNGNQLAAAACHAVAKRPARMYNPLFLYGGVGLGKTHLMHAIGNHLLGENPARRVAYIPSEQFMNQLVNAIREGTTPEFRRRYRQIDLLLVDDVHFLEGKDRTQEEFFHTFNALYDAQKQIVLTSDRPPKEIPGLEERLISRFEWGLVADIKPPDYETRVAILRKKAADDRITLDDEVIDFIARACTASVRELEGAVIKLLAYSSLTHQEITPSLARTALQGVLRPGAGEGSGNGTPQTIREAVAREWGIPIDALSSKRRTKEITVPRQVAMYLIKELLDLPLVRIGELFGGRDHSTVIHSLRVVEARMTEDPGFRERVENLRFRLGEGR